MLKRFLNFLCLWSFNEKHFPNFQFPLDNFQLFNLSVNAHFIKHLYLKALKNREISFILLQAVWKGATYSKKQRVGKLVF